MAFKIAQGIQVSLDNITWYKISDHNRQPINVDYEIIENAKRMANGKMRKYVIDKKLRVSTSWSNFPTIDSYLVDYSTYTKAGGWLKAFYEANVFQPIYLKIQYATTDTPAQNNIPSGLTYEDAFESDGTIISAFITSFNYNISKRVSLPSNKGYDFVDIDIEFTEI